MTSTLLAQIEAAEQQADQIRQQAQREARDIQKAVDEACQAAERQAGREMHDQAARRLEDSRTATGDEIKSLELRRETERDALRRTAQVRVTLASKQLFERIVGHGNR